MVMAKEAEKSSTMVHVIVITLSLRPSFVATRTTGPGSISVKALLSGRVSMTILHSGTC